MKLSISSGATVDCINHGISYGYSHSNRPLYIYGSTFEYLTHGQENGVVNLPILLSPPHLSIWKGQTSPLHTAAFFRHLDALEILIEEGADVNMMVADNHLPLMSALSIESYIGYGEHDQKSQDDFGMNIEISPMTIKKVLQILIDHGADPGLCPSDTRTRIHQLLNLSSKECEDLRSLVRPVAEPQWPQGCQWSFRDQKQALEEAIRDGADPTLCCQRDQDKIRRCLEWTEEEIEKLDQTRLTLITEFPYFQSLSLFSRSESE